MKLFIELDISPEEIPLATELFRTLRLLTDHVKTRDIKGLLHSLILRLEDVSELGTVASEISTILSNNSDSETIVDDFMSAFMEVIFNKDFVARQHGIVPYMSLLVRLPDSTRESIRDALVPKVLKHLTIKRPMDASRLDFFAHAEAFAALASIGFIPISGAISTIIMLLQKPENRCAAITMLGKTVELCLQQLNEECDPTLLNQLRTLLRTVTDGAFQYDINYIEESMGWTRSVEPVLPHDTSLGSITHPQNDSIKVLAESGSTPMKRLCAVDSYKGHKTTIFALAHDSKSNQLVSGAKDGSICFWSPDGQVVDSLNMAHHYACSMDIQPSLQTLFVCGVTKEAPVAIEATTRVPPCILRYGAADSPRKEQAVLSKEFSKLVSCIKAMGLVEPAFITGETIMGNSGGQRMDERICYYDMHSATSFSALRPLRQYTEHEDLITCLSLFPPNQNLFLSGSRDCTIRIWDRRMERSIGSFGAETKTGRVQAHESMVTCIDCSDSNMILSVGLDSCIHRWDFRALANKGGKPASSLQINDNALVKVTLGGGAGTAAFCSLRKLYVVDFSGSQPTARAAEPFGDGRSIGRYHDLKWAAERNVLYASGDDMRIDLYTLRT